MIEYQINLSLAKLSISFFFCRCPECENTEAYMRLDKVTSPIVIKFLVVSLIRIQHRLFLLIFKQENWLFTYNFVVYNSVLLLLVMYPVFSHVSCCFILFMLYVMYTCSIVSWFVHTWKRTIKVSQNYLTWGLLIDSWFGLLVDEA